jgi:hypothetical protein
VGYIRRKTWTLTFLLLLAGNMILFATLDAKAGVKVDPAQVVISMPEGYPEEDVQYKIRVTNPYSFNISVSTRIVHPFEENFKEGYARIPDLSWVKTVPEEPYIPANSHKEFGLIIDIPDKEKPLHYNESWEVWLIVIPHYPSGGEGQEQVGATLQTQVAVRVLINTPSGEMKQQMPQNLYFILGIIMGLIAVVIASSYLKKKKRGIYRSSKVSVFYFRKDDRKHHKNKKHES